MNAETLTQAMPGLQAADAKRLVGPCNAAMLRGDITTERRAAAWLAQVGHESLSLLYREEIASGEAYEGRRDLGNTEPGDGRRFKGRTFLQVTGRANYTKFSRWLGKGDLLVRQPEVAVRDEYVWLGPVWYWSIHSLNAYCDRGDFVGLTRAINGGTNGLADRQQRWERCKGLGAAVLPEKPDPAKLLPEHERKIVYAMRRHRKAAQAKTGKGSAWAKEVAWLRWWQSRCRAQMRRLRRGAAKTGWDADGKGRRYELLKRALAGKL